VTKATRSSRAAIVLALVLALVTLARPALAAWNASGSGTGVMRARSMPSGNTPAVSVSGRNVSVTWTASAFPDGNAVNAYMIKRYDGSGAVQVTKPGCAGMVAALSCTESAVPSGTWRYSVTPVHGNWVGSESSFSTATTVGAPSLVFTSSTTLRSLPTPLSGNITNFLTGGSVSFRLDDPNTGTLLDGGTTPSTVPFNGSASISVTIPAGTSNGSHTVYAVGNQGDVAGAAVIVALPGPVSLSINNGGSATGAPERLDTVVIGFSEKLSVSSLCSTWSNDNSNQSITANSVAGVIIYNNASDAGNDLLVVSTTTPTCGGDFRFGSIDLGSPQFVTGTGDAWFYGNGGNATTISWNATSFLLTVRLGAKSSGTGTVGTVTTATTATYSPAVGVTSSSGDAVLGTVSSTRVQF
jgi:hypothetical protein